MADEVIYRGYNEEIDVNMVPGGPMSVWHSSQYDELRKLRVNLYNGKSLQYLGSGVTVSLSVRKNDGNVIESSSSDVIRIVEENPWGEGSAPWRFIEINTTQQMTACVGKNICEIVVYETVSGETSRVGSANFILEVEKDPLAGGIESSSVIEDLQAQVEQAMSETGLNGLGDVNISSPRNGQILRYNSSASEWNNAYENPIPEQEIMVPANSTSFAVHYNNVNLDGKKIFVYRDAYLSMPPTNVEVSESGNTTHVTVSFEAESSITYWKVEVK